MKVFSDSHFAALKVVWAMAYCYYSSYLILICCRRLQAVLEDFSKAWSQAAVYSLYDHASD